MRINLPARGNRKLRDVIERVNRDESLKALWHAANVNAVTRLQINDHSWVHIQIVTNIGLKLLRELRRAGVEPGMVTDYGMRVRGRRGGRRARLPDPLPGHGDPPLRPRGDEPVPGRRPDAALLEGVYDEPERTIVRPRCCRRSSATAPTASRCRSRPASCAWPTRWTWPRAARGSRSRPAASRSTRCRPRPSRPCNIRSSDTGKVLVEIVMNNSAGLYQVDNLLAVEAARIRPGDATSRSRRTSRARPRSACSARFRLGSE